MVKQLKTTQNFMLHFWTYQTLISSKQQNGEQIHKAVVFWNEQVFNIAYTLNI